MCSSDTVGNMNCYFQSQTFIRIACVLTPIIKAIVVVRLKPIVYTGVLIRSCKILTSNHTKLVTLNIELELTLTTINRYKYQVMHSTLNHRLMNFKR